MLDGKRPCGFPRPDTALHTSLQRAGPLIPPCTPTTMPPPGLPHPRVNPAQLCLAPQANREPESPLPPPKPDLTLLRACSLVPSRQHQDSGYGLHPHSHGHPSLLPHSSATSSLRAPYVSNHICTLRSSLSLSSFSAGKLLLNHQNPKRSWRHG